MIFYALTLLPTEPAPAPVFADTSRPRADRPEPPRLLIDPRLLNRRFR